jgi:2-polyprenyl-3-methyl-5-hydroxy-6-metoxy-1,4-benzoquinol methylase
MKIAGMIIQSRVLDVGCGTGIISEMIKLHTQADIMSGTGCRKSKRRGKEILHVRGPFRRKLFNEHGTFDYIIFSDVLEHLENPAEIVRIAKKVK